MRPLISIEQMAEVMELRTKGVAWDNLGIIFEVSSTTLRRYVRLAERYGFGFWAGDQYFDNKG